MNYFQFQIVFELLFYIKQKYKMMDQETSTSCVQNCQSAEKGSKSYQNPELFIDEEERKGKYNVSDLLMEKQSQQPIQNSKGSHSNKKNWSFIPDLTKEDISEQIAKWPFIKELYKKNSAANQWKLVETLMKIPSDSDKPGFIYGFMDQQENSVLQVPYWIKMGRTNQKQPQTRIFQWQKDDNKHFTQIFTVRSLYNHKLESLVHALFSYARKNRVINGRNRIEWFMFYQPTMTAAAVNILNHIMNTIHQKYWFKNVQSSYLKTSGNQKSSKFYNKSLRQLDGKLFETNKQISQIINNMGASKIPKIIESIMTDLKIEANKNQIKTKLESIDNLSEGIKILKDNKLVIGNQIGEAYLKIKENKENIIKITEIFQKFEQSMMESLKNMKKSEVKFIPPSSSHKSTQTKPEQTVYKSNEAKQSHNIQQTINLQEESNQQIKKNITMKQKIMVFHKNAGQYPHENKKIQNLPQKTQQQQERKNDQKLIEQKEMHMMKSEDETNIDKNNDEIKIQINTVNKKQSQGFYAVKKFNSDSDSKQVQMTLKPIDKGYLQSQVKMNKYKRQKSKKKKESEQKKNQVNPNNISQKCKIS